MTSVAHLKALIILYRNLDRQVRGRNLTNCHALVKKAILLLKMANVRFDLLIAVYTVPEKMVDTPRFLDLRFGLYSPNHLG